MQEQPEDTEADDGTAQRREVQLVGEEDGDDQDRKEIVDDGEGEQERAQRGGQRGADDREDGEREGDVGGGRYGPALGGPAAGGGDDEIDERGHGHPADRGDHGQRGGLGFTQLPGHEFPLELDPGDEEEEGEQSVGGPVLDREIEAEGGGAYVEVAYGLIAVTQGGVGPDECGDGGDEKKDTAHGLGPQCVRDECPLGEGETSEELAGGGGGRGHVGGPLVGWAGQSTCRPDFPAHLGFLAASLTRSLVYLRAQGRIR